MNYDHGNNRNGLEINNQIRRLECELPLGFPEGNYNLTVIHKGIGALMVSNHAWNPQVSQTDSSKYMFKTLIQTETSGQHVISYLGGYLKIVAPKIASFHSGPFPSVVNDAIKRRIKIEYGQNSCKLTQLISEDEVMCYLDHPVKPMKQTYYAGNQGVSVLTKGCTKSFFLNNLANEDISHPAYTRSRLSSFFEAKRHPDSTCVRY
jgi:hypothetical protein